MSVFLQLSPRKPLSVFSYLNNFVNRKGKQNTDYSCVTTILVLQLFMCYNLSGFFKVAVEGKIAFIARPDFNDIFAKIHKTLATIFWQSFRSADTIFCHIECCQYCLDYIISLK